MTLEQRIEELEKKIAALERQVKEQPKYFIPEDSNGICKNLKSIARPD